MLGNGDFIAFFLSVVFIHLRTNITVLISAVVAAAKRCHELSYMFTGYIAVRCNGGHLYTHRSLFSDAIKNQLNINNKCRNLSF
jgi:hypothetical protein